MEITQNKCRLILYRIKIHRNCIKIRQNDEVQKDVKNASKIWLRNGTKNNNTSSHMLLRSLLSIRFVAVAFRSEEEVCWRREPPVTYFGPALDPPLGGSGRKTTTLVRDHEYFIPTKFHQNPSSGFGEEVENVKSLQTDGRRRRTDGRRTVRYDNSSLEPSARVS